MKNKDTHDFLILNGFEKVEKDRYTYGNEFCSVVIEDDHYSVCDNSGGTMYSKDLQIYWLIGVLTYYGLMTKNYKQLTDI